jgi:hypothetical protein
MPSQSVSGLPEPSRLWSPPWVNAIDNVLSSRVAAEDDELTATGGSNLLDRLLTPLNRLGSKRFLREARQKVWHNTLALQDARLAGPHEYAVRLAELELLSAAKIADLLRPGQVLLRLALAGFGVALPPSDSGSESVQMSVASH